MSVDKVLKASIAFACAALLFAMYIAGYVAGSDSSNASWSKFTECMLDRQRNYYSTNEWGPESCVEERP
jgi:hypothetical protein